MLTNLDWFKAPQNKATEVAKTKQKRTKDDWKEEGETAKSC